ncbi:MAG: CHASE2 domain-containing protein [Deltaproteobacteria bacterium]|nr:CHASE2 domain-containing protein [Deltaproteobacteria bacterium]
MFRWPAKAGRRSRAGGRLFIIAVGLALTALMSAVYIWQPPFLVFLDHKTYDTMLRALGQTPPAGRIVMVDVDEKSVARRGQWPWPRYLVAHLLDAVNHLGATVVAIDFLLTEPDRTSLAVVQEEMSRELGVTIQVTPPDLAWMDNDRLLAATLKGGPFVLGMKFLFGPKEAAGPMGCILRPVTVVERRASGGDVVRSPWFTARGVVCNLPSLAAAVKRMGFVDVGLDADGVLRRVPLLIQYRERFFPSLALATYLRMRGGNHLIVHLAALGAQSLQVKENLIPVDAQGQMLINYRGPAGTFPSLSATDILDGRVAREAIAGKLVLVGTSAAGLKDLRATPLHSATSGVEVQANILDNLLAGDYLVQPAYAPGLVWLLILVCGLFSTLWLARSHALGGFLATLAGAGLVIGGSAWSLKELGLFWSPLWPTLTLALTFSMLTLIRFWREEQIVKKRTRDLAITQQATIVSLASLAETRHSETGGHIQRTQMYVKILVSHLKEHPKYRRSLDDAYGEQLVLCAPLHDVGKVGVPDAVLLKPGPLTPEEYEVMKKHTTYGLEALQRAGRGIGDNYFLQMACDVAHTHHERWDGKGYPQGLRGDDIPLAGRLMAVADVYDALVSPRVYKKSISLAEAAEIIRQGRGSQFDPDIVDVFLQAQEEFRVIATEMADRAEHSRQAPAPGSAPVQ